jgi:hypothetical protein
VASQRHRAGAPLRLWLGLFLPPLAVLADLQAGYALAPWACADGGARELLASSALAAALALAGGALAWRSGGEWPRAHPHGSLALRRGQGFLALAGAVLAAGSLLPIAGMALVRGVQGCG